MLYSNAIDSVANRCSFNEGEAALVLAFAIITPDYCLGKLSQIHILLFFVVVFQNMLQAC